MSNPPKQLYSSLEQQLQTLSYDTLLNGLLRSDTYYSRDQSYPMTVSKKSKNNYVIHVIILLIDE